jgi:predicted metal-binding protein
LGFGLVSSTQQSHLVRVRSLRTIFFTQRTMRIMAKRRGNPNWGKPEPIGPVVPTVTSFEQVVKEYKLTPDQYIRSTRLREWARRNKNSKYIPEALLEAWGFEIESSL